LNNETFAEGFGEGTEDAHKIASYIDEIRAWMRAPYDFFDMVNQRRAWNEGFYESLKSKYPDEYEGVSYEEAFYSWQNGFKAIWPPLIREPESERIGVEDVKLKALIAAVQVLLPFVTDPDNKVELVRWCEQNFNATETLFSVPLELDYDTMLEAFTAAKDQEDKMAEAGLTADEPAAPPPFSQRDTALAAYLGAGQHPSTLSRVQKRIIELEKKTGVAA
jgi:hypothetical protein